MNVRNRKHGRRRGQAIVRLVLGVGTAVAGAAAYLSSDATQAGALVVPGLVIGVFGFGVALYGRARTRREWSAAWDAYAESEVTRNAAHPNLADQAWSWAGTN
jgi:hypothetical protein